MSRPLQVFLTIVLSIVASQVGALITQDCPAGVPQDKYLQVRGDYCYEFVMYRSKAFNDAQRDCQSKTGTLVSIPDSDTQDWVYDKLRNTYGKWDVVWIGLDDQDQDHHWQWVVDGSVANFTNWAPGQPGGFSLGKELCAVIDPSQKGTWHDYGCTNLFSFVNPGHPYICQYGPLVSNSTMSPTFQTTAGANTSVVANSTPQPSTSQPGTPQPSTPQPTVAAKSTPQPTVVAASTPAPSTAAPAAKSTILSTIKPQPATTAAASAPSVAVNTTAS